MLVCPVDEKVNGRSKKERDVENIEKKNPILKKRKRHGQAVDGIAKVGKP